MAGPLEPVYALLAGFLLSTRELNEDLQELNAAHLLCCRCKDKHGI